MTPAERILDHLDGVRETGPGRWTACCPAHDDKSPSLSIREVDDRLLLFDFGGCSIGDILDSLGLTLSDLFDDPPESRGPNRQHERRVPWRDVIETISHEAYVITIAGERVCQGEALTQEDIGRVYVATRRISDAVEMTR